MFSIILFFILGFVVADLLFTFFKNRNNLSFLWKIYRKFTLKMFLLVLCEITAVIFTCVLLVTFLPFTSYGWTSFLGMGDSNFVVAPIVLASDSDSIFIKALGIIFILFLAVMFPFLAKSEEDLFRRGQNSKSRIIKCSIAFGLMHLLMGVPLAAGLALIISGFFYAYVYVRKYNFLRDEGVKNAIKNPVLFQRYISFDSFVLLLKEYEDEAVLESTAYHTLHNLILVSVLLLTFF